LDTIATTLNFSFRQRRSAKGIVAKDKFHNAVKNALIKEEWTITDDSLFLQFGGVDLFVDLGAEKMIARQKDNRRIAVEIKSFLGASLISEFHTALGQLMTIV
jgi:hypothetical protein